ncbi:hypothetical protein [Bdellovibrio bacteriovorus]|nr:hypothetical protein [Bdellovibrio bacteriovorus]
MKAAIAIASDMSGLFILTAVMLGFVLRGFYFQIAFSEVEILENKILIHNRGKVKEYPIASFRKIVVATPPQVLLLSTREQKYAAIAVFRKGFHLFSSPLILRIVPIEIAEESVIQIAAELKMPAQKAGLSGISRKIS